MRSFLAFLILSASAILSAPVTNAPLKDVPVCVVLISIKSVIFDDTDKVHDLRLNDRRHVPSTNLPDLENLANLEDVCYFPFHSRKIRF